MSSNLELRYFDISWVSTVDGPGTRAVLFLQGCHLRCPWCHSPHSREMGRYLMFFEERCDLCGFCVTACPKNVHRINSGHHEVDRSLCDTCGQCIAACPKSRRGPWGTRALAMTGSVAAAGELFRLLKPQLDLLKNIGGLTVSGGEPLLQFQALKELLKLCSDENIHTAVETSASLPNLRFKHLNRHVDTWLVGLRPVEPGSCPAGLVADLNLVEAALEYLAARARGDIIIRTPLIPGYTDNKQSYEQIISIMNSYGLSTLELLPFNGYSDHFYTAMGKEYPLSGTSPAMGEGPDAALDYFVARDIKARLVN